MEHLKMSKIQIKIKTIDKKTLPKVSKDNFK